MLFFPACNKPYYALYLVLHFHLLTCLHLVIQAVPTTEDLKVQTSVKDGGEHLEAKDSKELDSTSSSSHVIVALPESSTSRGAGSAEVDSTQLNGMHSAFFRMVWCASYFI